MSGGAFYSAFGADPRNREEQTCSRGHKFVPAGLPIRCAAPGCDSVLAVRLSDLVSGKPGAVEDLASGRAVFVDDRALPAAASDEAQAPLLEAGFASPEKPETIADPGDVVVLKNDYGPPVEAAGPPRT